MTRQRLARWIDRIALLLILGYWWGCFRRGPDFAETRIWLGFLDLPLFLSEALLGICLGALALRSVLLRRMPPGWRAWGVYAAGVVAATVWGRVVWGPLAYRDAVMFCYPALAYVSCIFMGSVRLGAASSSGVLIFLLTSLILADSPYPVPLLCLSLALVGGFFRGRVRVLLAIVVALALPYERVFGTSRTMLVANLTGMVFLVGIFLRMVRWPLWVSAGAAGVILLSAGAGVVALANRDAVRSLAMASQIWRGFQERDKIVRRHNPGLVSNPDLYRGLELFCPNDGRPVRPQLRASSSAAAVSAMPSDGQGRSSAENLPPSPKGAASVSPPVVAVNNQGVSPVYLSDLRDINTELANVIYRLFIWRDMAHELKTGRRWFGVGLGKPLRSPSLETLVWGSHQWRRDGWVSAHNSWLHIVYRFGVLGAGLILLLLAGWLALVRRALRVHCWSALGGAALLLVLMVAANFIPVFEFPYHAVLFWSVFGMSWALMTRHEHAAFKRP